MSSKPLIRYAAGLVVAVVLMAWVLRDVDRALLIEQLRNVSLPLLLACVFLNLSQNLFRVWRWRALLEPVRAHVAFRPMFAAVILGYMTSWVIPGRLGELVRPLVLASRERLPIGPCVGTVVADRLLDGCAVVVMFALGAWIAPLEGTAIEHATAIRAAAAVSTVMVVGALVAMLAITANESALESWLVRRGATVRWLGRAAMSLSRGVRAFRSPRLLVRIVLHTALCWAVIAAAIWVGVRSVGVEVSPGAVLFIMPLLVLGVAVPTPGGAGSYHAAMNFGLSLFGVSWSAAAGAGLIVHAAIIVPVILLGLLLLGTEGIGFRNLIDGARQLRGLGDPAPPPHHVARAVELTS